MGSRNRFEISIKQTEMEEGLRNHPNETEESLRQNLKTRLKLMTIAYLKGELVLDVKDLDSKIKAAQLEGILIDIEYKKIELAKLRDEKNSNA